MKKLAILCSSVSDVSAYNLAIELDAHLENPFDTKRRDFTEFPYVFKYGFSPPIKANIVFNKAKATQIVMNKIKTFSLFSKEGITVDYTLDIEVAKQWIRNNSTAVARNIINGYNGEGLVFCSSIEAVETTPAKFWTRYFHHTNELRINCWRGTVVSIYDKEGNKDENFHFKLWVGHENHPQLVSLVKKVWEKTKIDWCGLDVFRNDDGELKLLEINSAPVLYPYTERKLSNILRKEMK